jgi:maltooligosyltrehalose trehalohydrolase
MTRDESTVHFTSRSDDEQLRKYHPVGSFYSAKSTVFAVWAPERKSVALIIHQEKLSLIKDDFGYWQVRVDGVLPGDRYFFQLDNGPKMPDPASLSQPDGVHEASSVVDRAFDWRDAGWKGLSLGEMVIYELHVGTFTDEGTFAGIEEKLDYLKSVGVNAIELMPVAQFPGTRNWGYDGVFPFAVQTSYGGVRGLKQLVDVCHQNGVAVILDVVYNHLGPEGNYLEHYGPYFTDKYKTGWGKAINYDDAYCDGVRNFFLQNALMWLEEFHIDGLRLDAIHAIWDSGAVHFIEELRRRVSDLENESGKKKVLIAEFDLNNPRYINPPSKGGYGLDGQWIDEFHHALHSVVTGEKDGYYEDFGDITHLERAYRDSYVYTGQYSRHRKKYFGTVVQNSYDQFVVFAQNHDQVGNRLFGDRLSKSLSFEQLKLVASAYLLSPYVPMLFMGEEYGERNPFQYFISHSDEKLVQAVREGRKKEFEYFGWKEDVPDPQSEATFQQCKLSWNYESDKGAAKLLDYYRFLITFRKTRKAMRGVSRDSMKVFLSNGKIICFTRAFEDDAIVVVLNFSDSERVLHVPVSRPLSLLMNSASEDWYNPNPLPAVNSITLAAHSIQIFEFTT